MERARTSSKGRPRGIQRGVWPSLIAVSVLFAGVAVYAGEAPAVPPPLRVTSGALHIQGSGSDYGGGAIRIPTAGLSVSSARDADLSTARTIRISTPGLSMTGRSEQ